MRIVIVLWMVPLLCQAYTPPAETGAIPALTLAATQPVPDAVLPALQPYQYAQAQNLDADVSSGSWSQDSNGLWHWRLRLSAPGALSLALRLQSLQLPEQAELWFYDTAGRDVQGPFTNADGDSLLTPLVRSDEAVLDASMPAKARDSFALRLTQIFLGIRPLLLDDYAKSAFGTAGACTIDVACSDGDAWRDDIRSVVLITIEGTTLCTGTLMNNTAQDDRALILTAEHCGVDASTVSQTRAYFNVQKSRCAGGSSSGITQNMTGARVLAASTTLSNTDYTLFELSGKPPLTYNVYYAGWDVTGAVPASGVGISHPSGDDKKISTFSSPPSSQNSICIGLLGVGNVCVGITIRAWSVSWSRGATQPGSSGSGLWNPQHRVVATLSGGNDGCSSSDPSRSNGGTAVYQRLDLAWSAASSTGTKLQALLDPLNTGCTGLSGKNYGNASTSGCGSVPGSSGQDSGGGGSSSGGGGGGGGMGLLGLLPLLALGTLRHARRATGSGAP